MARNQLARLLKDDTLIINDANTEAPTQVQELSPLGRGYQGGFAVGLMKKDLDLAMEGAREFGIDVTLGKVATELYDVAVEHPD
ncbi:3-hydroxyisobutyrate dehydrogenase-related conserved site [Neofusicoccum parvum]|uniref:3-hydroxyisobutyrate dehydrogenase-related conserved site n=1 Tax=Neofusicoccum parvum TaxID=310453 RepID=A0ACB5SAX1_9PEZI|nr:3-hydroxyisobutyrate dehydrogenase-related conserved site [Neofusicoccum parvum]